MKRNDQAYKLFHRKIPPLEEADHRVEIFRLSIPRPEDIQFLLYVSPGLLSHRFFRLAFVNDPAGK